jgi:hypothetical protein
MLVEPGPIDAVQARACRFVHPGETRGRVDHALLVPGQVVRQVRTAGQLGLEQGLTYASDIP